MDIEALNILVALISVVAEVIVRFVFGKTVLSTSIRPNASNESNTMPKRLTRPFSKKTVTRKVIKQWLLDSRRGKLAKPIDIRKELCYHPKRGYIAINEIWFYIEKHRVVTFNRRHKCNKRSGRHKKKSGDPYRRWWKNVD